MAPRKNKIDRELPTQKPTGLTREKLIYQPQIKNDFYLNIYARNTKVKYVLSFKQFLNILRLWLFNFSNSKSKIVHRFS